MDKEINNKDLVTWGLMIAALYFLSKADCGCGGQACSPTNPMSSGLTAPNFVQQLAAGEEAS